jgi:hypothetical protein
MSYAGVMPKTKHSTQPRRHDIDRLPYGLLEITDNGQIVDYIPFKSQIAGGEVPQVCGLNIIDTVLSGELFLDFRNSLPELKNSNETKKNWLITLPLSDRTVRVSIVASKNQHSSRIRISLAKVAGVPAIKAS